MASGIQPHRLGSGRQKAAKGTGRGTGRCRLILGSGLLAAATGLVYAVWLRPWHLRWGATDDEVRRPMPLDARVADPAVTSTRAVTIDATPAQLWPWIAQIGEAPRAGFYSYALVERLQGMRIENAERLIPECQQLAVGQALDRQGNMVVQAVAPEQYLVLGPPDRIGWLRSTWAFGLCPLNGSTRLVTRLRATADWRRMFRETPPLEWPFMLLLDPGVFVMERKMLLEIKRLAESHGAGEAAAP